MKRWMLYVAGMLVAVSCVKLPVPRTVVPDDYIFGETFSRDTFPRDVRWWEYFGDTTLNRLEEMAIAGNLDLAAAASRVEAARKSLPIARAAHLPEVSFEASASGGHEPEEGSTERYEVTPTLSWEISLFGALRYADHAARAGIGASEWAFRGVVLSLTAQVAITYFTLLKYERGLEIAERTCELRRESAALIDSMFRYGMASGVSRDQSRSLVYTAAADVEQYRRSVDQTVSALAVLLGETPRKIDLQGWSARLDRDRLPDEVPVGLPSDLLTRRPDVVEAMYKADQAAARVGLARAERFPTITLTGSGGLFSSSLKGLTTGDPWGWSVGGSLMQPIFAFGKLKRQEQVARENYYEAVFGYRQALLQALSDVESALVGLTSGRSQLEQIRMLAAVDEDAARKTRALYRSGMAAYLDVIDAERSWYASELNLSELVAQQYIDYVVLFKALGGGW